MTTEGLVTLSSVVDASAMVEALVGRPDDALLDALAAGVDAPHLLDVEVLSALRGLQLGGKLASSAAQDAVSDYLALTITRYEAGPFAERIWALRHQLTSYDAAYVALAEALGVPLHTADARLARASHRADVRVVGRTP